MNRNPQILGSRAARRFGAARVALGIKVSAALLLAPALGACGLKGPLYMPSPAAASPTATPADTSASAAMPSTSNTSAR